MKSLLVLASFAFTLSTASAAIPAQLNCTGTEPFWSLEMTATGTSLSTPDTMKDPVQFTTVSTRSAEGTEPGYVTVYALATVTKKTPATLVVNTDATCNDGMSDNTYAYSATYISGIHVFSGCCNGK